MLNVKINLGDEVEDIITGFKGIASARTTYLHGSSRIGIQPPMDKEGKIPDAMDLDQVGIRVIKEKVVPSYPVKEDEISVELGQMVKDPITGFEGMATGWCQFLNGCVRVQVTPKGLDKEGNLKKTSWFDAPGLEAVPEVPRARSTSRTTGGPIMKTPPMY